MRIELVKIGNSQGIRLPKSIIEQAQLTSKLELEISPGAIIIRSVQRPRETWEQDAIACHAAGEDLLDEWDATAADFEGPWE